MSVTFAPRAAHGTERRVSRRVEERDLRQLVFVFGVRHGNRVSADVLRDAAGFARGDVGFANHVEQRRLAMVNVAHDGDDRRARFELFRLVLDVQLDFFGWRVNHAAAALAFFHFKPKTIFRAKLLGDFFVNRLVHVGKNAQLHQIGDDLERLLLELRGQFTHGDRRFDDDDLAGRGRDKFGLRRGGFGGGFTSRPRAGGRRMGVEMAAWNQVFAGRPGATAAVWPNPLCRRCAVAGGRAIE